MATGGGQAVSCKLVNVGTLELKDVSHYPWFTGLVVSADMIMVVDSMSHKLCLYDRHDGKLLTTSDKLQSLPRDICIVEGRDVQVVVTLYNGQIEILSVISMGQHAAIRRVKTFNLMRSFHRCDGVRVLQSTGNLVVSGLKLDKDTGEHWICWGLVSLVDGHAGTVYKICKHTGIGWVYLATSHDNFTVYSSCMADSSVYAFVVNTGRQKFMYRHCDLKWPRGISVDKRGFIFVCNLVPSCIHQLGAEGEPVAIHREAMPSRWPRAMYWEEQQDELYITSDGSKEVWRFHPVWSDQQDHKAPAFLVEAEKNQPVVEGMSTQIQQGIVDSRQSIAETEMAPSVHVTKDSEDDKQDPVIPLEILHMDDKSLQLYKKALQDGQEKVYNIRIMVVGQYGVGKTTLIKRLLGQPVDISERKSTEGIQVHQHCCKISLDTGEWIVQPEAFQGSDQLFRLHRLMKVLSGSNQKPEVSEQQEGQSEVVYQRESVDSADSNDTSASSGPDVNQKVQSAQLSLIKVDERSDVEQEDAKISIVAIPTSESESSESEKKKKDVVMEIIQLINENADKLGKHIMEYALLALWDFAGQYVFYTTHQTFLTRHAIYLLVIDLNQQVMDVIKDDECFFDMEGIKPCKVHDLIQIWMNSIHSCALSPTDGVPPVILVGTHVDKIAEKSQQEVIDRYFMQIRRMLKDKPTINHLMYDIAIDNTLCDSRLEDLKEKIFQLASQQAHWGEPKPTRWLLLEQAIMTLKASGVKVVPRSLIEEINRSGSVEIKEKDEMDLFLRFQHEIGTILYFCVEGLMDKIVLDPQWMIDALKSLITAENFIRENPVITSKWYDFKDMGKLTHELIDAIWTKERNAEFHDNKVHILHMMEMLNIITRPKSFSEDRKELKEEDYYLAPCMLRQAMPKEVISPESDPEMESTAVLCFVCTNNFLPPPVFHRIIGACLTHWPIAKQKSRNIIYCGCCVFDLDHNHRLTMHFRDHVIFARVTKMRVTDVGQSSKLCSEARKVISDNLSKIIGNLGKSLQFEINVQCPQSDADSLEGLISVSLLQKNEQTFCHSHDKSHTLVSRDLLKYWFEDEIKQNSKQQQQGMEERQSAVSEENQEEVGDNDADAPITMEHMNHARLCNALTTVCADALRKILLTQVPAPHRNIYQAVLANKMNLSRLNKDQYQLVFPDPQGRYTGTVDNFDISLLYTIIRNISALPAPSNGWGNLPTDQPRDTTLEASVERIRLYRNKISGHSVDGKISQKEFEEYWKMIDDVLLDIENVIGNQNFREELEERKNQVIMPHEARELQKAFQEYKKEMDAAADEIHSQLMTVLLKVKELRGHKP